jgi:hypothetical protein
MLAYCDYISFRISQALQRDVIDNGPYSRLSYAGNPKMDLHKDGYMLSTKKTMDVIDVNGKIYKITVEEVES